METYVRQHPTFFDDDDPYAPSYPGKVVDARLEQKAEAITLSGWYVWHSHRVELRVELLIDAGGMSVRNGTGMSTRDGAEGRHRHERHVRRGGRRQHERHGRRRHDHRHRGGHLRRGARGYAGVRGRAPRRPSWRSRASRATGPRARPGVHGLPELPAPEQADLRYPRADAADFEKSISSSDGRQLADTSKKHAQASQEFEDMQAKLALDEEFMANSRRSAPPREEPHGGDPAVQDTIKIQEALTAGISITQSAVAEMQKQMKRAPEQRGVHALGQLRPGVPLRHGRGRAHGRQGEHARGRHRPG